MELIDKQATIDWLKKVTVTEGITFEAGFKQIIYDIEQMPCVEVRPEKKMTIGVAIAHLEDLQRMYLGNEKFKADVKALDVAIKALEQQPKTGHWIEKDDFDGDTYYDCSECGESFCLIDGTPTDNLYNYCPNCGAKMAESEGDK